MSESGAASCAACGGPLTEAEVADPHWGEGQYWHKRLHRRCCPTCVAGDLQVVRNADACLGDPDAPLQAKAWAAVAKRYATAALSGRQESDDAAPT